VTVLAIEPKAGPAAVPAAYAKAAVAKAKRDRQSYAEFRRLDQQEFERYYHARLDAAVAAAESDLPEWQKSVTGLEAERDEAVAAFRAAEDRWREAVKFADGKRREYERVKGEGTVQEEYDATIAADTADGVAADAAEVMEQKRAEMAVADENLAEEREGLARPERTLDTARKEAAIPAGTAPVSDLTINADAAYMQSDEVWDTLTETDRRRVRRAVEPRNMMTGEEFWTMLRQGSAAGGNAS
jgi:hypothetical protein